MRLNGLLIAGAVTALAVIGAGQAMANSYGQVSMQYEGVDPAPAGQAHYTGQWPGVYVDIGRAKLLVDPASLVAYPGVNPARLASFFDATTNTAYGYCIDIHNGTRSPATYVICDLADAPVPIGQMTPQAASDLQAFLQYHIDQVIDNPNPPTATEAAAMAASIWEIVNEPNVQTAGYGLTTGGFKISEGPDGLGWASLADTWLAQLNTPGGIPQPGQTFFYAFVNQTAQDFTIFVAGDGLKPPVPEPLTMVAAFFGVSGLGVYMRKRIRVG